MWKVDLVKPKETIEADYVTYGGTWVTLGQKVRFKSMLDKTKGWLCWKRKVTETTYEDRNFTFCIIPTSRIEFMYWVEVISGKVRDSGEDISSPTPKDN